MLSLYVVGKFNNLFLSLSFPADLGKLCKQAIGRREKKIEKILSLFFFFLSSYAAVYAI